MALDLSQTQPESMTHRPRTIVVVFTREFFITVSSLEPSADLYSLTDRNQFDSTILRSAFGSLVGCHKIGFAEALRNQTICRNTLTLQVCHHRLGTTLGQTQIVCFGTDRVGVAVHLHSHTRVGPQGLGGLIQYRHILWTDFCLVEIEVDPAQH